VETTLGYIVASAAFVLGGVAAFIPGFPGSAVALIGLVAFAGLTDFAVVNEYALLVGALVCIGSTLAQIASPAVASRAAGGTAGAASGAALGATIGALVPLPGAPFGLGLAGAVLLGLVFSREGVVRALRGMIGAASGCAVAVAVDLLAVLVIAGILAISVFAHRLA
jgi:uncharacterized protein YqgC (DUF456 family)